MRILVPVLASTLVLAGACSSTGRAAGPAPTTTAVPSTTAAPSTTTATTTTPPTTAPYAPSSPQPSPDAAAAKLVSDWSTGNRSAAGAVADPTAVATLFGIAYPSGWIQDRGCTDASANPGTCTYRNTQTDAIYEIAVSHIPAGWYVSGVTPET